MSQSNITAHQAGTTIPKLDAPFVTPDGRVTPVWLRFLNVLWNKTGQATPLPNTAYIAIDPLTGVLTVYQGQSATPVGQLPTTHTVGGPPEPQTPSGSPWEFVASTSGTLTVAGAQVNLGRGLAPVFYPVSLQGGAVPLLAGDKVQLVWFGNSIPVVTWFPTLTSVT